MVLPVKGCECYVRAERSSRLEKEGYDLVASLVGCEAFV